MTPPIAIRPKAASDLEQAAAYLAERSPQASTRFLDAASATFNQLAAMPRMGTLRRGKNPRLTGLRSWSVAGFRNYLIFYLPRPDGIEIVRIYHAARDIDRLLRDE